MMNFPAWRCARTSARICWTSVAIVAAKAGSTQYVIPRTVASGVLGGLHSAATSVPAQRNSAASVSAGRSMLIGLPPSRPRRDERRALGPERAAERLSERRLTVGRRRRHRETLPHSDQLGRVGAPVGDRDDDDRRAEPDRRRQLRERRAEPRTAREADGAAFGVDEMGRDRRGQREPYRGRPVGGDELPG